MKVLLNDGMDEEGVELFNQNGIEVDLDKKSQDSLVDVISEYDALIVRSATKPRKDIIEAGANGNLKIIGRAGVGYDNVDVNTATKKGIIVKYAPNGNTNATAELTLGIMLAVARNIPQADTSLKDKRWLKSQYKGVELSHKTLGILGCGRIGQRLSELVRGFDMNVIGYDLFPQKDTRINYMSKEDVIVNSDFLSIHAGGDRVIVGKDELEQMKPTSYLINAARGCNVDPDALYNALVNNQIAGAALDVHHKEGKSFQNNFEGLDNIIMTPHLGASSKEAQRKTSIEMAEVTIGYLLHGDFTNAVNAGETIESEQKSVYPIFIHHKDVSGVFASIDNVFAQYGANIRENNSRQIGGNGNVVTVYLLQDQIESFVVDQLKEIPTVYDVKN
jgi:D-3-phosphoglycerate dehydrogenase / 2-oxoglutarate reductase